MAGIEGLDRIGRTGQRELEWNGGGMDVGKGKSNNRADFVGSPAVSGYTYVYSPEGERVSKQGSGDTDYIYFAGREVARLTGGQWIDLIYGVSGLLAEVPGTQAGSPVYRMVDHLGTVVGTLNSSGIQLSSSDYAPFGQLFAGGTTDPYQFTGKERDTETGNDYFGARYYASSMGRFMSPDWSAKVEPVPYAKLGNPQSLNLYSYVWNNPLSRNDPDGHYTCTATSEECATIEQARNAALKSDDKSVVAAAKAYGSPTDQNKIYVGVGDVKAGEKGSVSLGLGSDGKADGSVNVTFQKSTVDAAGETLEAGVAHEGQHVKDDKTLIDGGYKKKDNMTRLKFEERGYSIENRVNMEHGVSTSAISSPEAIDKFVTSHPDIYPSPNGPILPTENIPNPQ